MYKTDAQQGVDDDEDPLVDVDEAMGSIVEGDDVMDVFEDVDSLAPCEGTAHTENDIKDNLITTSAGVDALLTIVGQNEETRQDICELLLEIEYDLPEEIVTALTSLSKETLHSLLRASDESISDSRNFRIFRLLHNHNGGNPPSEEYSHILTILEWLGIDLRSGITRNKERPIAKRKIFIIHHLRQTGTI